MGKYDYLSKIIIYITTGDYDLKINNCKYIERPEKTTNLLVLEMEVTSGISKYNDGEEKDATGFKFTVFQNLPKEKNEKTYKQCFIVSKFFDSLGITGISEISTLIGKEITATVTEQLFNTNRYYNLKNIRSN